MEKNKPAHQIRVGHIKATIWRANTDRGAFFTTTFSRIYKVDESWRQSHSFNLRDFEALSNALALAKAWMTQYGDK